MDPSSLRWCLSGPTQTCLSGTILKGDSDNGSRVQKRKTGQRKDGPNDLLEEVTWIRISVHRKGNENPEVRLLKTQYILILVYLTNTEKKTI